MDLNGLADFNAVVAHGGFGRASRATGRPKASLSRRVLQLEHELGVRLLQRGVRGLLLTEEGAALHASTARLLEEVAESSDAVSTNARHPNGRLRVSVPTLLAQEGFGRFGAQFMARYPDVRLEVNAEDRFVDCIAEDYDIVIRANPAPDTELAGRCFLRDRLVAVAPPGFAARAESGHEALAAITLPAAPDEDKWRLDGQHGERVLRVRAVARFSSISMIHDAVAAGLGAAVLPRAKAQAAIDAGQFELLGVVRERSVEVWALYATRRQLNPKISAFVNMLVDAYSTRAAGTV